MADISSSTGRSWRLIKASLAVISADGELLLLPLLSGIATAALFAAFIWLGMSSGTFQALHEQGPGAGMSADMYVWLLVFYIVQYFVVYFFNTALVGAALERLDGGDPTIRSALGLAVRRIGPILGYAFISATVGMILRLVAERLGFIGRIIETSVGLAWTVATFLVVPVLAAEGIGPVEAIEKSVGLIKKTWGESLIGTAGMGIVFTAITVVTCVVFIGGGSFALQAGYETLALIAFIVGGAIILGTVLLAATLSAVFQAAVYDYAATGRPPRGFDGDLISEAFRQKS
jgi:hypothetical protein